ncbi:GntR family transcriptional regulator [Aeromicrobium sp. 9AM]|uniref:GntR family transcriptional regulator n=1 Tax=Aeromicrobium sp. 9AM TaxID=2653126 RepID=UPI0012F26A6D|nr:GntR family transcriptional regulator [Aeromicrobium sp. 9AM]VXB61238.1 DNA-binding transcriptional regulator, GntR family [Aeromicrobium sp. 9AM]
MTREADTVATCLARMRQLVLTGELLPGEKLNQAELAARLGVSRVPVREALASLRAEGLVEARPNTGYTVVRPTLEDLSEIYLMRELLEDALLATVDLELIDVDVLNALNERLSALDPVTQFAEYRSVNEAFHFAIFDASPQRMVRRQVNQLWVLSDFYRSMYVRTDSAHRRVVDDHVRMTAAIGARDREALVRLSDEHRDATRAWLGQLLTRRS